MQNQPHIPWDQGARGRHFQQEAMYNPPAPWQQDINVGDHQVQHYPVHYPFQGSQYRHWLHQDIHIIVGHQVSEMHCIGTQKMDL